MVVKKLALFPMLRDMEEVQKITDDMVSFIGEKITVIQCGKNHCEINLIILIPSIIFLTDSRCKCPEDLR